ncbi:MAG: M12 family metallopeptidase [Bacteriovoracaceae bacterium]
MKKLALFSTFVFLGIFALKIFRPQKTEPLIQIPDYSNQKKAQRPKPPKEVKKEKKPVSISRALPKKENIVSLKRESKKVLESRPYEKVKDPKEYSVLDADGNLFIENIVVDGDDLVAHGDILVGSASKILEKLKKGSGLVLPKPIPWTNGIVPYVIQDGLKNTDAVRESIEYFNSLDVVKFVPRDEHKNFISFEKGENNCYSHVGMIGGKQKVSLSERCGYGEINHEITHALGFFHEQNREDRDDYIEVHWYNIDEMYHPQFKKIPNSWQHLYETKFDFKSIMLYPPTAFSLYENDYAITTVEGEAYEKQTDELSRIDILRLKMLYTDSE